MEETRILRESLLQEAYCRGLLTRDEYLARYKGRYVDPKDGSDAFFGYLTTVLCFPDRVFITRSARLREDGDQLLDKFGVVIQ